MIALKINGLDAKAVFGFRLATPTGWADSPGARYQTGQIPGRAGALALQTPDDATRELTLSGIVEGADAAEARENLDWLRAELQKPGGTLLIFGDQPTREYTAQLDRLTVAADNGPVLIDRQLSIEIRFTCLDPYAYDTATTTVALSAAPQALALGTGPTRPLLTLTAGGGGLSDPLFTLYESDGVTVAGTLGLTIALAAGDTLVIDCDDMTVRKNGADAMAAITAGDFLVADAALQGDYRTSAWPKLKLTLGAGTTSLAEASYRKAYR